MSLWALHVYVLTLFLAHVLTLLLGHPDSFITSSFCFMGVLLRRGQGIKEGRRNTWLRMQSGVRCSARKVEARWGHLSSGKTAWSQGEDNGGADGAAGKPWPWGLGLLTGPFRAGVSCCVFGMLHVTSVTDTH